MPHEPLVLERDQAAVFLFGDRMYEADFDPANDSFRSGADVCQSLAEYFEFTVDELRSIARELRSSKNTG